MNLYDLTGNYLKLQEILESGEEQQTEILNTMEMISDSYNVKAENYGKIIKMLEDNEDVLDKEIERLRAKKSSIKKNKEWLKENLLNSMIAMGIEKIKTSLFNISISNNKPAVAILNEEEIPEEYIIISKKVNVAAINKAISNGEIVAGAALTQGRGLRIR